MSKKAIQIKYLLERKDYNALRTYFMYRRTPKRTKILVSILLVSLILLVLSETAYAFPFFKLIGLAGFVVIAAAYTHISFDTRKLENVLRPSVSSALGLYMDDECVTVSWKGLSEAKEWVWSEMNHAYENDAYFFLFTERHFAIIIPKILLKEPQIKEIHRLFETHISLISDVTNYQYQV